MTVSLGKTCTVINECATAAGQTVKTEIVESDAVLVSLFVESITGDLDLVIQTFDEQGTLDIITFPTQSAPSSNLLLRKAGDTLQNIRIIATYTDEVKYRVVVRGISSSQSDVSVVISGADNARASQIDVGTSPTLVVPSALTDRGGMVVKNYGSGSIFVGFSLVEADTSTGYPLSPGEALGMDVAAGIEVYAVSETGTQDVRLLESGS